MRRSTLTTILTVIVILLVGGLFWAYSHRDGSFLSFNKVEKDSGSGISDYSAVFLTNGQVYFGKVYGRTDTTLDLRNIYYLQVNQNIQQSGSSSTSANNQQSNVSLVKLGQELHGPNDRMQINMSQVLFTESLKDDSKVVKAIQDSTK